ncbi:beta-mannanase [Paenibacillus dendritiformis]|uniref:beta-mannanase n=1 Tax=Paenibacillus dendritiformis TaxID=130049 RepID=UPI0018CE3799|nr:beta-mannanase [Paenibacillus dendritiformis]MBG9791181.1 beta-mannanase [Paenibacillus dendritiformis]
MHYTEAGPETPVIRGLTHSIDEERCTLRWLWPDTIQAVYVHKAAADRTAAERPPAAELKLYTRDEYKANNGYHDRIEGIGRLVYTIYACLLEEDGQQQLVIQPDGGNRIALSTGRARIYYSIRYKGGWFKKFKTAQIQVTAEVPLPADVLCYVKKHGGYPAGKDDGTVYPFVEPFAPGRNMLPEIEIGKDDYIRLFFTDGRQFGQLYELIPE